jgi:hypothetical protein
MYTAAFTLLVCATASPEELSPAFGAPQSSDREVTTWLAVSREADDKQFVREGCVTLPSVEALARRSTSELYEAISNELGKWSADRFFASVVGNLTGVDPFVPDLTSIWQGPDLLAIRLHRLKRLLEAMTSARARGADKVWLDPALISRQPMLVNGSEMVVCPAGLPLFRAPNTNADPVRHLSNPTLLYVYSRYGDFINVGPGTASTTQWGLWVSQDWVLVMPPTKERLRVTQIAAGESSPDEHVPVSVLQEARATRDRQSSGYRLVPGSTYPIIWSQRSCVGQEVDHGTAWLRLWGVVIDKVPGDDLGSDLPYLLPLQGDNESVDQ